MVNSLAELSADPARQGLMTFEQPLTERMRTFLRVELLYGQTLFHAEEPTDFGARAAVAGLLETLTILGRGDVRGDVLKELEKHAELLARFRSQPGVDLPRLTGLIDRIDDLKSQLAEAGPNLMSPLKKCDFLNTIRHRSAIPGGTCVFDLPDYGYWLHLPFGERIRQLREWTSQLRPLCDAVTEVLWLVREATDPASQVAAGGLYQHSLGRNEQMSLVRILLPASAGVFPEISAGPHRFTVRFVRWQGVDTRPVQVKQDVRFLLGLC